MLEHALWTLCYLCNSHDVATSRHIFNAMEADTDHDGYRIPPKRSIARAPAGCGASNASAGYNGFASLYRCCYSFVPDSGATRHCINDLRLFSRITQHNPPNRVRTADGALSPVAAIGEVDLRLVDEHNNVHTVTLRNCLYLPSFHTNLLSIKQLYRENRIKTKFAERDYFKLRSGTRLYFDSTDGCEHHIAMRAAHGVPYDIIHKRYGHCGARRLRLAATLADSPGELRRYVPPNDCVVCEQGGKSNFKPEVYRPRKPIRNLRNSAKYTYFGERVNSDLCVFEKYESTIGKFRYALCFVDEFTGYGHVEYLKSKDSEGVKSALQRYQRIYSKYLRDGHVAEWHTDFGGEFSSKDLDTFCDEISVKRTFSVPYEHNSNPKAERFWGLLLRPMRAIFADSKLPMSVWPQVMDQAVKLHNCLPTSRHDQNISPYQALTGQLPNITRFRVLGCRVMYDLPPKDIKSKLASRSVEAIHLGFDPRREGYRVYVPSLKRFTTVLYRARFNETVYPSCGPLVGCHEEYESPDESMRNILRDNPDATIRSPTEVQGGTVGTTVRGRDIPDSADRRAAGAHHRELQRRTQMPVVQALPIPDDQRDRASPPAITWNPDNAFTGEHGSKYLWVYPGGWSRLPLAFDAEVESVPTPTTYEEAIRGTYKIRWKQSMDKEITDLLKHNTWELVPRSSVPKGRKPCKSKWVYKVKFNRDGTIDKFKSRFVVCGYSQKEGVDYDQSFSATLRATSFRWLLAVSAQRGLQLEHMDVTSAFTQAALDDVDIWCEPAKGYESYNKAGEPMVYKLKQALYGTKQASRLWQQTLRGYLLSVGFTSSLCDPCLFVRRQNGKLLLIAIYVDDIVCAHNCALEFGSFKQGFCSKFRASHLGPLSWFLGMSIDRGPNGRIELGHQKYIEDLVNKFVPDASANHILRDVPCSPEKFSAIGPAEDEVEKQAMRSQPYMELVGALLYLATMSRPDICYHMSKLCKHMQNPNKACWSCAVNVLLYLYRTRHKRIVYTKEILLPDGLWKAQAEINNNMGFHVYSDSSWNVPSPSYGFCVFMSNGPISFASKTIKTADSSCEAEYTAASKASRDIAFIRQLSEDMGFTLHGRLPLACDNTAAIDVARNLGVTARNKHFERELHYIREQVELRRVAILYIPTAKQTADIFTKALDATTFKRHLGRLLQDV